MSFGDPGQGTHPWTLDQDKTQAMVKKALDAGINFFDTANSYSAGTSEEFVGRALKNLAKRDEIVLATKVWTRMRPGANGAGLSRKVIMFEIDQSLRRLGTDYVDLYQIHRWDPTTPIEETLQALDDLVRAGKVRYIGASTMYAWQFTKALYVSKLHGWARFATMQNYVNLLYREEEREMLPLCEAEGIGVIPWSPLARGRLTRDWDDVTERSETDGFAKRLFASVNEADKEIVNRVAKVARDRDLPRVQIALAWVLQKQPVSAPIIGATKPQHLDDAIAALSVKLTGEEVAYLEEPYVAHPISGF
jgi:aryl-alcohol dehydrogenase-like predicted oxidoreductase